MAGIDPCFHISRVDYLYYYLSLLLVFNIMHDNLEHSHCSQVSITLYPQMAIYFNNCRFFAWYLFGVSGCASPILYSTVNTIVKDDSEERALILVCSAPTISFIIY